MIDLTKYPHLGELVDGIPERPIGLLARSELKALILDVRRAERIRCSWKCRSRANRWEHGLRHMEASACADSIAALGDEDG